MPPADKDRQHNRETNVGPADGPARTPDLPLPPHQLPCPPTRSAPRRTSHRAALWAVAAAVAAVASAAGFVVTSQNGQQGSSPTTTASPLGAPSPPFSAKAVEGLVIPAAEIPAVTGLPAALAIKAEKMHIDVLSDPDYRQPQFVDSKCAGKILFPGSRWFYNGSGWLTSRYQASSGKPSDDANRFTWRTAQFISVYPDAASAANLVDRVIDYWQPCEDTVINGYAPPAPERFYWSSGSLNASGDSAIIELTQEGGGGWKMWRAMAAHNNVVVDLMVAAQDAPESAIKAMLNDITSRIDAPR